MTNLYSIARTFWASAAIFASGLVPAYAQIPTFIPDSKLFAQQLNQAFSSVCQTSSCALTGGMSVAGAVFHNGGLTVHNGLTTDTLLVTGLATLAGGGISTTPTTGDNSTAIATTAWVRAQNYTTTAASGVSSFNGRTGAVVPISGDISGALGYTPASSSSPNLSGTTTIAALTLTGTLSGGQISNTAIGTPTRSTGAFTTLAANGAVTLSSTLNVTGITTLAGGGTSITPTTGDNSTAIATTAWVKLQGYGTGGSAGVASFNGRTGVVGLTSGDVIGALGFTPANIVGPSFTGGVTVAGGLTANAINSTPVGVTTASTGRFTSLTVTTSGETISAGGLNVTGGATVAGGLTADAINNTPVGATTASTAQVTALTVTSGGTITAGGLLITGGLIADGINSSPIGAITPATGKFTGLTVTTSGATILAGGLTVSGATTSDTVSTTGTGLITAGAGGTNQIVLTPAASGLSATIANTVTATTGLSITGLGGLKLQGAAAADNITITPGTTGTTTVSRGGLAVTGKTSTGSNFTMSNVNTTIAQNVNGFQSTGTVTGTTGQATSATQPINLISTSSDTVNAPFGGIAQLQMSHRIGAGARASRNTLDITTTQTATTGSNVAFWGTGVTYSIGDLAQSSIDGGVFQAQTAGVAGATQPHGTSTSFNDGGVTWAFGYKDFEIAPIRTLAVLTASEGGTSTVPGIAPFGGVFGINTQAQAKAAATNLTQVVGNEDDLYLAGTAVRKVGIQVVLQGSDVHQGAYVDGAFLVAAQLNITSGGWRNGYEIGDDLTQWPMDATRGTMFNLITGGNAGSHVATETAWRGVNVQEVSFSDAAWRSRGPTVIDGTGKIGVGFGSIYSTSTGLTIDTNTSVGQSASPAAGGTGWLSGDFADDMYGGVWKVGTQTAGVATSWALVLAPSVIGSPPANPLTLRLRGSSAGAGATINVTWATAHTLTLNPAGGVVVGPATGGTGGNMGAGTLNVAGLYVNGVAVGSGTGGSVTSFNTRTGTITLLSADVTTALTYTPANLVAPSFTGGITVAGTADLSGGATTTTAPTNDNTTKVATTAWVQTWVTSQGYGTGSGGVTSFNTRTGVVTLTSGDVTTALTYTPANLASPTFTGTVTLPAVSLTGAFSGGGVGTIDAVAIGGVTPSAGTFTTLATTSNVTITGGVLINGASPTPGGNLGAGTLNVAGLYVNGVAVGAGGGGGVDSFNTRTGAVTLTSSDVTTALTFTPANAASPTITGVATFSGTGGIVVGTPTGLNKGTGTVNATGLFINGNAVVQSFNTRLGAITLTSGDVTTALTYTPANLVAPSFTGGVTIASGLTVSSGTAALSGGATTTTAPTNDNTTKVATTAWVQTWVTSQGFSTSTSGVASFNARTGAVTLISGDVTGALGFTPASTSAPTFSGTVALTGSETIASGLVVGPASGGTGGNMGAGTINVSSGVYVNGTLVGSGGGGTGTAAPASLQLKSSGTAYAATANDFFVGFTTTGARTVSIPACSLSLKGQVLVVFEDAGSAGNITLTPPNGTISGTGSETWSSTRGARGYVCDGVNNWAGIFSR